MDSPAWKIATSKQTNTLQYVTKCLAEAEQYINDPPSAEEKRWRGLRSLGSTVYNVPGLEKWVKDLHALFDEVTKSVPVWRVALESLDSDLRAMKSLPQPPEDRESQEYTVWDDKHSTQFWEAFQKVLNNHGVLEAQSRKACPTYAKMLDIYTILGQLDGPYKESSQAVLFNVESSKATPVAITAYEHSTEYSKPIIKVQELTVTPGYLLAQGKGAGTVLMGWLAREVPATTGKVVLLSLGEAASRVYAHWGFERVGDSMQLSGEALSKFLAARKDELKGQ